MTLEAYIDHVPAKTDRAGAFLDHPERADARRGSGRRPTGATPTGSRR